MLIENQFVEVKVNSKKMADRYSAMGYKCQLGDTITIRVEDSIAKPGPVVKVKCDYCGKICDLNFYYYRRIIDRASTKKYACSDCVGLKRKETCLDKYGSEYPGGLEIFFEKRLNTINKKYGSYDNYKQDMKRKREKTCLEKYGVKTAASSPIVRNKMNNTFESKYGVSSPSSIPWVQEKREKYFIEKYGVRNPFMLDEVKEKIKKTNLKRYGFECALKNENVKLKQRRSVVDSNNIKKSKGQETLCDIVGGDLNVLVGLYVVDILESDGTIIEYDGSGHDMCVRFGGCALKDFVKKEKFRESYLIKQGHKIIRFINKHDRKLDSSATEIISKCHAILDSGAKIVKYDNDVDIYTIC